MSLRTRTAAIAVMLAIAGPATADQEAGNAAHVAAGPYGRCYAKSVPDHLYDPEDGPRQQGRTTLYRVTGAATDEAVHTYPWFSQSLHVLCGWQDDDMIVRLGPWHRGHEARADHLAIAFYRGGQLLRSYSTLEIAGQPEGASAVSASVSHYTVFSEPPRLVQQITEDNAIFRESWIVEAKTVNGRTLRFDPQTGALL